MIHPHIFARCTRALAWGLLLAVPVAGTAAETYRVNAADSTITWDGKSTLHDFTGTTAVVEGVFCLEKNSTAGYIIADATSLHTGTEKRDHKMHHEFMETERFGTITFTLRKYLMDESNPLTGTAFGTWNMHGVDKELSIPIRFEEKDGNKRLLSDFPLTFTNWGIVKPRVLVITMDPTVLVHLNLALTRDDTAVIPNQPARNLAGITLADALGAEHHLGDDSTSTIIIYHDYDNLRHGISWGKRLAKFAPANTRIIAILNGASIQETGRERLTQRIAKKNRHSNTTVLLDWNSAVAKKIYTVPGTTNVIVFDAEGNIVGNCIGSASANAIKEVYAYAGITAITPVTALPKRKKGSRRRR